MTLHIYLYLIYFQSSPFIRTFNNSDYTYVKPSPSPEPNTVSSKSRTPLLRSLFQKDGNIEFDLLFFPFRTGEVISPVGTLLHLRLYQTQVC